MMTWCRRRRLPFLLLTLGYVMRVQGLLTPQGTSLSLTRAMEQPPYRWMRASTRNTDLVGRLSVLFPARQRSSRLSIVRNYKAQDEEEVVVETSASQVTPTSSSSDSSSSSWGSLEKQESSMLPEFSDDNGKAEEDSPSDEYSLSLGQQVENVKCILLGIGVGIWSVLPFTAFHYFVYQPQYTSLPQWEFDTYAGALQGALFALVYRYTVLKEKPPTTTTTTTTVVHETTKQDDDDDDSPIRGINTVLSKQVVQSFVGVRTLSRVKVSMVCTALPLYCGEVLRFLSWDMALELTFNYVESAALFGAVAMALQKAWDKGWIRPPEIEVRLSDEKDGTVDSA